MKSLTRRLPTAAWLLAAPFAQAGDGVLSVEPARVEVRSAGGWSATASSGVIHDDSLGGIPGRYDHPFLSAGIGWKELYARYDYTYTRGYLGLDGISAGYLDVGARHPIGRRTFLNLNAGNGRVTGSGNAPFDWRDLRAGFSRKLDDNWTMALNYRRVFGNATLADRFMSWQRNESRMPGFGRGHRGIVLSFKHGF